MFSITLENKLKRAPSDWELTLTGWSRGSKPQFLAFISSLVGLSEDPIAIVFINII